MKFELEPWYQNISDQELLLDLKETAAKLNKSSIPREEYDKKGKYHSSTIRKRFGGWNKAIKLVGLSATKDMNIADEQLFKNLEEVWVKLGRQPRKNEMLRPLSFYSIGPYAKRYGSWRKALEEFVKFINESSDASGHIIQKRQSPTIKPTRRTKREPNWRLRFLVMRRDSFKCQKCGRSPSTHPNTILHIDHVIPWSKGGETVFDNLRTLCLECNIGKNNLPDSE